MAKMEAEWNGADADQDGYLNEAEFAVWVEASRKRRSEDGFYVDANA